jgi:hypothetical protein
LFVYSLFEDAFSVIKSLAPNGSLSEWWIVKMWKESVVDSFWGIIPAVAWKTEETTKNSVGIVGLRAEILTRDLPNTKQES